MHVLSRILLGFGLGWGVGFFIGAVTAPLVGPALERGLHPRGQDQVIVPAQASR